MQNMVFHLPTIEVADYRHALGIGRPNTKLETGLARLFCRMAAKMLVEAVMGALAEEVDIVLAKEGMRKYGSRKVYRVPPGCVPPSRNGCAPAS